VHGVSDGRLEFEIRRLPGVLAVDVRPGTVSVLVEPACDAVALGATLEALLAYRGLAQEIRIVGGMIPTAVRPHRLSAMAMGSVAGIGLLGVATAAALQGALPTPDFQQEHRLAPVAGAPARPSVTTTTTGPRLRIVAGEQPEWAAAEPTLVIPSTTTVSSPATARTPRTVRDVLVAAAARIELPDLVASPPTTVTPTTEPSKPSVKPIKSTTTTVKPTVSKPTPTTTKPDTGVARPTTTTTTTPKSHPWKEKDKKPKWKWGNRREDPGGPRLPRPPKAQGPKTS
jgi:hypothetical protein